MFACMSQADPGRVGFLDLPAGLHIKIYELALIPVENDTKPCSEERSSKKGVREEFESLYYSKYHQDRNQLKLDFPHYWRTDGENTR
jgi:hypothetical protein